MPTSPPTLYAQQISSLYNGLALWDPHPGYALDSEGELTGLLPHIRPGDVGCVEEDGTFTRLFNIHLIWDHPHQGRGPRPDNFELVPLNMKNVDWRSEVPMVYHSHKRLNIFGGIKTMAPVPVNGSASLAFERNTGAILGFFDHGSREDSRMDQIYKEQLIKNGSNWLAAAKTVRDRRHEDIILVTGCTRVRSWITGVVENQSTEGHLKLSVGFTSNSGGMQVSTGILCENSGNSIIKYGPGGRLQLHEEPINSRQQPRGTGRRASRAATNNPTLLDQPLLDAQAIKKWSDQCIFIRGFRMKQRITGQGVPKRLKAAAGPQDPSKDDEHGKDVLLGLESEEEEEDVDQENTWDHIHMVLDYILSNSDADFALAHENDLWVYANAGIKNEHITIDQVLKECHPEVSVQDHNGIKVGVLSEIGLKTLQSKTGVLHQSSVESSSQIHLHDLQNENQYQMPIWHEPTSSEHKKPYVNPEHVKTGGSQQEPPSEQMKQQFQVGELASIDENASKLQEALEEAKKLRQEMTTLMNRQGLGASQQPRGKKRERPD